MALFLYSIGPNVAKIYNSFGLSEANRHKLSEILEEFDNFAIVENNKNYECYVFNSHKLKREGESMDTCVGELRTLAQSRPKNTCTILGQRKQRHNIQSKQAENVQTGNVTTTRCLREISHVLCVEENTEKVDPTVQLTRDLKR